MVQDLRLLKPSTIIFQCRIDINSYQLSVTSYQFHPPGETPHQEHRKRWCQYNHTSPRKRHCGWYCSLF